MKRFRSTRKQKYVQRKPKQTTLCIRWKKGSAMWYVERFQRVKSAVANLAEKEGKKLVGFEPWAIPKTYEPHFPFKRMRIDLGEAVVTGRHEVGDVTVLEVREKPPHPAIIYAFLREGA